MRFGLVSDVHGNNRALEVVLASLHGEVDAVLFLGDLFGYYPFVEECAFLLSEVCSGGVRGNHDQILLDCYESHEPLPPGYQSRYGSALCRNLESRTDAAVSFVRSLPCEYRISSDGVDIVLFHGSAWDPLCGRIYPDFKDWDHFAEVSGDVILLGHTHYPLKRFLENKLIVNPGSVGQPRDRASCACYAILDIPERRVEHFRVPFDPEPLIADAQLHDPNLPYLVEVLIRT